MPTEDLSKEQIADIAVRGNQILNKLIPKSAQFPVRIFDYGCGVGLDCLAFSLSGADVYGSDYDEDALLVAKKISPKTTFYHQSQIPPEIQGTFDLVWCSHVIEHLVNPVELIEDVYSLLKPSGKLCILTPNSQSHEFLFRKDLIRNYFLNPEITYSIFALLSSLSHSWIYLDPPRHLNVFSTQSLGILTEKHYDVCSIKSEYTPDAFFNSKASFDYSVVRFLSIFKIVKNIFPHFIYKVLIKFDKLSLHGDSLVAIMKKKTL
ncbi:MAG: class I SAM-dependent methyltransferase [Verrucomicrobiota bacterium]